MSIISSKNKPQSYVNYLTAAAFLLFGRYIIARLVSKSWGKKLYWQPCKDHCYIKCPGGNLIYAEFDGPKEGQPIVFIHGINANNKQWYYQRNYFNKKYRLIFLDVPMHSSNYSEYKLDIPTLASDINSILIQLKIQDAVIYGHSMGGTILIEYCLKYPRNTNTKAIILHGAQYKNPILANPFSFLLKPLQKPVIVPMLNLLKRYNRFFNIVSSINFLNGLSCLAYRYVHFSGNQTAQQLIYVSAMAPNNDTGAFAESILQMMRYNVADQLKSIDIPVLIIGGIRDRLSAIACSKYMHRHIPTSQLKIVEQGHQSMVENHQEINIAVAQFINRLHQA